MKNLTGITWLMPMATLSSMCMRRLHRFPYDIYLIALMKVGYNNPALVEAAQTPEFVRALMNRPALGIFSCVGKLTLGNFPPQDWGQTLTDAFLSVAPPGQTRVYTAMCGSCANETAYKVALSEK